jgi:hypothetical protein
MAEHRLTIRKSGGYPGLQAGRESGFPRSGAGIDDAHASSSAGGKCLFDKPQDLSVNGSVVFFGSADEASVQLVRESEVEVLHRSILVL